MKKRGEGMGSCIFSAWWKGLPSFLFLIKDVTEDRAGLMRKEREFGEREGLKSRVSRGQALRTAREWLFR